MTAYLTSIAQELAPAVELASMPEFKGTEVGDRLLAEGLRDCRVADEPFVCMGVRAARRVLDSADTPPTSVIYCTDRPDGGTLTADLHRLLGAAEAPVGNAVVTGGLGCGNLGPALRIAADAIRAGSGPVLLVTADAGIEGERYLPTGLTALSDGAAACIVTAAPTTPAWAIVATAMVVDASLDVQTSDNGRARAMAGGIRRAVGDVLAQAPAESEIRHVIGGNYGRTSRRFLTMAAGLGVGESLAPLVADVAHCYSADALLTLETLTPGEDIEPGDRVLVLSTGGISWTATILEYVTP